MRDFRKVLAACTALLLLANLAIAAPHPGMEETENADAITAEPVTETGIFQELFSFLFVAAISDTRVEQGTSVTFDSGPVEATTSQTGVDFIVEVNKCTSTDLGSLTRDDCNDNKIVANVDTLATLYQASYSTSYTIDTSKLSPGGYEAVAYLLYTPGADDGVDNDKDGVVDEPDDILVSVEEPNRFFEVAEEGTLDDDTSEDTGSGAQVRLESCSNPSASASGQTINGEICIRNTGDADMGDNNIVEMQVRPDGADPLSFVGETRVCDTNHPENVHKGFQLDAGDEKTISLESEAPEDNRFYDVYFFTRNQCFNHQGDFVKTPPFENGRVVENVEVGSPAGEPSGGDSGLSPAFIGLLAVAGLAALIGGVIWING